MPFKYTPQHELIAQFVKTPCFLPATAYQSPACHRSMTARLLSKARGGR